MSATDTRYRPVRPTWYELDRASARKTTDRIVADRKFQRRRHADRLRLLAADPHCDNCRGRLQGDDHQAANYANVVDGRLSCRRCRSVVRALAAVERWVRS